MHSKLLIIAAACLMVAGTGMAGADNGKNGNNGKNYSYGNCPPGLAKKDNGCRPPGQAKKADTYYYDDDEDHDHVYYRVGQPLPRDVQYVIIDDYNRYGLVPPPYGTRYVRIGDDFYRVNTETNSVIELVRILSTLLN